MSAAKEEHSRPTGKHGAPGHTPASRSTTLLAVVVVLATLHLGREILMPLALAMLVSFALGGPIALMERLGCGRTWAVGIVVGGVALVAGATLWMAFAQLQSVIEELPNHSIAVRGKIDALVSRFAAMEAAGQALVPGQLPEFPADDHRTEDRPPVSIAGTSPERPLYTVAADAGPTLLRRMPAALGALVDPLGTGGMVLLFAVFMLIYREDLRNRIIRLVGRGDLTGATLAINEASHRIGRFLGFQAMINVACGLVVAFGLHLLGVPGWALWGLLYTLLRFLPYVGAWIGAAMPAAMALAAAPGWSLFLAACAFFLLLELLTNLVVEPWLFGESTGASSFAVLVTAAFWTWLWGPVGLLLAMPLTAVVVVMGKSVPQLGFLNVLLGTDAVMSATDRFYQRVVGNDIDEALRILTEVADGKPLAEIYERVLVAGLVATERDRMVGKLTEEEYASVCENIRDALGEMERKQPGVAVAADQHAGAIACLPVKTGATEVATAVLMSLLQRAGHACRPFPMAASFDRRLEDLSDTATVCLVSLPDPTLRDVRAASRRVRAQGPTRRIVVLVWTDLADAAGFRYRSLIDCTDAVATSAAELLAAIAAPRVAETTDA